MNFLQTKAHLDLLEHRINLNKDVLEISNDMSQINKQLINLNKKNNENKFRYGQFNKKQIETNQRLLKGNIIEKDSQHLRQQLIEENKKLILELEKKLKRMKKKYIRFLKTHTKMLIKF